MYGIRFAVISKTFHSNDILSLVEINEQAWPPGKSERVRVTLRGAIRLSVSVEIPRGDKPAAILEEPCCCQSSYQHFLLFCLFSFFVVFICLRHFT